MLWRHLLSLNLQLSKFTTFKQKRILTEAFVESQFQAIWVYEFQTETKSDVDIFWISVWSYLSLRVSNEIASAWRRLLSLSLKLCKVTSFKQNRILMKAFVKPQLEVMSVYEFQINATFYEDICSVSVWSYVGFWVSNQRIFWLRYFLSLSFELSEFMSFIQQVFLLKTFVASQFEVR